VEGMRGGTSRWRGRNPGPAPVDPPLLISPAHLPPDAYFEQQVIGCCLTHALNHLHRFHFFSQNFMRPVGRRG